MLNLLFISCNPKMEKLKNILQPQLKVKVDVVDDFDLGLKEVLEKRPAAVVIQDHISGVAGESIVRHIQMLLGKEAPKFILLYEGDVNVQSVQALFEQCIDLVHSEEQLAEEILSALKNILGEQWKKVFALPETDAKSVAASVTVSPKDRSNADKMVDDLISDMGGPGKTVEKLVSPASVDQPDVTVTSTTDEMAAMLIEATRRVEAPAVAEVTPPPAKAPGKADAKASERTSDVTSAPQGPKPVKIPASVPGPQSSSKADVTPAPPKPPQPEAPIASAATASGEKTSAPPRPSSSNAPVSPADFHVSGKPTPVSEPIPEELLLAFEANYRSQSHPWRKMAMAVGAFCVLGAAGWFMLSSKQDKVRLSQKKTPTSAGSVADSRPVKGKAAPSSVAAPRVDTTIPKPVVVPGAVAPSTATTAPNKTATAPVTVPKPAPAPSPGVPSFVSQKTKDASYATRKPGWERYVDSTREVRIFRTGDRIKAVQVMAGKGKTINKSFLETVLQELAGTSAYTLGPKERKQGYQGYLVQRGSVGKKAELIVYRKKTSDAIVAFVVSLD